MLSTTQQPENQQPETAFEIDLQTIRQRVAAIKRNWTLAEAKERAVEGRQRRQQLEEMLNAMEPDLEFLDHALVC